MFTELLIWAAPAPAFYIAWAGIHFLMDFSFSLLAAPTEDKGNGLSGVLSLSD